MYVGILKCKDSFTFTHTNSEIEFSPTKTDEGHYLWRWDEIFDTGVDIHLTLLQKSFVGAVNFELGEPSLSAVCVLVGGKTVGRLTSQSGELIGESFSISVGAEAEEITLRLFADFKDVRIKNIEVLGAYDNGVPLVWPTPKSLGSPRGYADITEVLASRYDKDETFAADFLKERLSEKLGSWKKDNGVKIIMKKDSGYSGERYTVKCEEDTVTVTARSRIALLYGADTVLSLATDRGLCLCDADDFPAQRLRGIHFGLPHKDRIDFARRLMRYVLIPMRYNTVFLEFAGGMRFDRHPEISEGWLLAAENAKAGLQPFMPHSDKVSNRSLLEKECVRELVGYIKELGLALIPEVQSLAHVQYITYAHPDIAELDDTDVIVDVREGADARPEKFYAHSYCPTNPKSYEIIYDIIDEIIEVTDPDGYVHMGHDEVYQIGLCERCREYDPADLFARHVTAMHDYLAKRGLGMMMWADMLHPAPVTDYPTAKAIEKIPKDIILLDFIWYFHPKLDIEDTLLSAGFKVAVGNLYSSHYTRFKKRIQKDGMIGGEISTWIVTDEQIYGTWGKLWDIIYLSEMLWNTEGYEETNRKSYNKIISKYIQPATRDKIRGKYRPHGYKEIRLPVISRGSALPRELSELVPNATVADGAEIKVGDSYERIIFEHATLNTAPRIVWQPGFEVGEYTVEYENGEEAHAKVIYGENVTCYKGAYAIPKHQQYYRHFGYVGTWFSDPIYEGKCESGEDVSFTGFVWENPYPNKKIKKITYKSNAGDYCNLVIAGARGLK